MVMMVTQVLLGNGFKSAFMLLVMRLPFFCFLQGSNVSLNISPVVLGIKGIVVLVAVNIVIINYSHGTPSYQ